MTPFNDLVLDKAANDTAAEFVRDKIGETVKDPGGRGAAAADDAIRSAPSASASTRIISRRSTATTSRWSTSATRRSRRSRRTGIVTGGKEYEARRDRVRDRLRRDDRLVRQDRHPRARRADAEGEVGGGAEDLSRPDGRGLSQHVPRHRAGQPVGALQHDRVDRAACRLDRRLPRAICATRDVDAHRGDAGRGGRLGRARQRGRRTPRSIRRRTPGTWARTFPASRACSCPISAAFRPIGRSATRSRRTAIGASR